jgi:signal peptidase I
MPSDIEKFVESLEAETTLEEVQSAETATEEATAESLVTEVDTENSKEKKIVSDEQPDKKKQFHLNVYDFVSIIMVAFIIIALIFTFVFRLVGVKGQSMESTLFENDWLITMEQDEYVYGDIVVITEPNYFNEPLIKRVIATAGQIVDIDYSSSTVYVDGVALNEPYINESFILQNNDDITFPYTVPEGHLFCMGDNRNHSTDSRSTLIGAVDERYILGRAMLRILPFGDSDIYDYE